MEEMTSAWNVNYIDMCSADWLIFFENGTNSTSQEALMHKDQVDLTSKFALAIAGWGQDANSQPILLHEEQKLVICPSLSAAAPGTTGM